MSLLLYRGEDFNANFYYQSGADIDHSFFLKAGGKSALLVPEMNKEYAESVSSCEVRTYGKSPLASLAKFLKKSETLSLDFKGLPASLYLKLSKAFRIKNASTELAFYRSIKSREEVAHLEQAASLSKKLIGNAGRNAKETEAKTASSLLQETHKNGSSPAFAPIVASGKNSSYPHSVPTKGKISSPLMIDYGTTHKHYCGDVTRCFLMNREQEKIYSKLKRISKTLIDEVSNLGTGSALASLSKKLYEKEGLAYPPHGIGHGIGLEVHEMPSLSPNSKHSLLNSVFTIEPSVYFKGKYGLRYENAIHFDGKKARVL